MEARKGFKLIRQFPEGENIMDIVQYDSVQGNGSVLGKIIVATNKSVYHMQDEKLIPIAIEVHDKDYAEPKKCWCSHPKERVFLLPDRRETVCYDCGWIKNRITGEWEAPKDEEIS